MYIVSTANLLQGLTLAILLSSHFQEGWSCAHTTLQIHPTCLRHRHLPVIFWIMLMPSNCSGPLETNGSSVGTRDKFRTASLQTPGSGVYLWTLMDGVCLTSSFWRHYHSNDKTIVAPLKTSQNFIHEGCTAKTQNEE